MATQSTETTVPLARIRTDGGTQARESLRADVIEEYAERYKDKKKLPPPVVFLDGDEFWLADGFYRIAAARQAGLVEIEVEQRQGTLRDASLYAAGANSEHGVRRSSEDKRNAVLMLLRDDIWREQTDRWIADQCNVSPTFVGKVRASVVHVDNTQTECHSEAGTERRTGKDGKTYSSRKPRRKRGQQSANGQIVFSWANVDDWFGKAIRELDNLPKMHKGYEEHPAFKAALQGIRQAANAIKTLKKQVEKESR
jgi:hypothetical protein